MKTNKEKYDYYLNKLIELSELFVKQEVPTPPEKLYQIIGYYNTKELLVKDAYYCFKFYKKEKPTRNEVSEIKEFFEKTTIKDLKRENIRLSYYEITKTCRCSSSISLTELEKSNRIKPTLEELQPEIQKNKELYEPRDGYINCAYCHKVVEIPKAIERKIIFRNSDAFGKQFVDQKYNKYCTSDCACHDQYAHEG